MEDVTPSSARPKDQSLDERLDAIEATTDRLTQKLEQILASVALRASLQKAERGE